MAVFDFGDARAFFESIERVYERYREGRAKSTENLLYVIMGLNHLREWIPPGFGPDRRKNWPLSRCDAQEFSRRVYEDPSFETIRSLCNATKHARKQIETDTEFGLTIDEWPDVGAVADFSLGPPSGHCVNGKPIDDVVRPVIELYAEWFLGRPQA